MIFQSWEHCCAYCGNPADTIDHIRPRYQGGASVLRNMACACRSCNQGKGSTHWLLWYRLQPFWDEQREALLWAWQGVDGQALGS